MSFRRAEYIIGTTEDWVVNPVLPDGQLAADTDANSLKIGDGITPWDDLDYITADPFIGVIDGGSA